MNGCGRLTHVHGTNGGTMPCGAMLTRFGKTEPYYCTSCEDSQTINTAHSEIDSLSAKLETLSDHEAFLQDEIETLRRSLDEAVALLRRADDYLHDDHEEPCDTKAFCGVCDTDWTCAPCAIRAFLERTGA
jgi:hypothetical protein